MQATSKTAYQTSQPIDYLSTPSNLTGQVLERKGCPIHYWTGGQAGEPAVFCLHGALMDHRMFNAQVPPITGRFRFLSWDGRGHGLSQPIGLPAPSIEDYCRDAAAVLDQAGVGPVVLVGQSLGAYIAQHFLRLWPERVLGLVVIGSTPVAFPVSRWEFWALQASAPMFRLWPYRSLKPFMARSTAVKEDVVRYAESAMDQVDLPTFLSIWSAVSGAIRPQGYPDFQIDVPFLLTHGDADKTGTIRRDGPRWAASDPRIEYQVIPDAGHNANQDNPEFFNRVLMDFLQRRVGS